MVNHSHLDLVFQLPPNRPGKRWYRVLDTGTWAEQFATIRNNIDEPGQEDPATDASYTYKVGEKSIVVLMEK
jgi:hypothetical protein